LVASLIWSGDAFADPADVPPTEASSQLRVELVSLTSDVHGGDGDGSIALWTLLVEVRVHNDGPEPAQLERMPWSLHLGNEKLAVGGKLHPQTLDPGKSATLMLSRYLPLPALYSLREDRDNAARRQPRAITGEVYFTAGGELRYAPFTVRGRYHDCCDSDFQRSWSY